MASTKVLNCSHALALSFEHSHEVYITRRRHALRGLNIFWFSKKKLVHYKTNRSLIHRNTFFALGFCLIRIYCDHDWIRSGSVHVR